LFRKVIVSVAFALFDIPSSMPATSRLFYALTPGRRTRSVRAHAQCTPIPLKIKQGVDGETKHGV
jgi:hypothetical protein